MGALCGMRRSKMAKRSSKWRLRAPTGADLGHSGPRHPTREGFLDCVTTLESCVFYLGLIKKHEERFLLSYLQPPCTDALNDTPYLARGWCYFESCVSIVGAKELKTAYEAGAFEDSDLSSKVAAACRGARITKRIPAAESASSVGVSTAVSAIHIPSGSRPNRCRKSAIPHRISVFRSCSLARGRMLW